MNASLHDSFFLSSEKRENPPPLQRKVRVVKGSLPCLSILKLRYALASSDFEGRRVQYFLRSVRPADPSREHHGDRTYDQMRSFLDWNLSAGDGPPPAGVSRLEFRSSNRRRLLVGKLVMGWAERRIRLTPSPRSNLSGPSSEASNWGRCKTSELRSLFSSKLECKSIISGQASKITSALRRRH